MVREALCTQSTYFLEGLAVIASPNSIRLPVTAANIAFIVQDLNGLSWSAAQLLWSGLRRRRNTALAVRVGSARTTDGEFQQCNCPWSLCRCLRAEGTLRIAGRGVDELRHGLSIRGSRDVGAVVVDKSSHHLTLQVTQSLLYKNLSFMDGEVVGAFIYSVHP